jgi:thioredoxin reductase (NADPH)
MADGLFVFIRLIPNTQFLTGSRVKLDPQEHIITNEHLETSVKGVYASGDVRSGSTMQIATAVGEGATAAMRIREYLDELKREEA